MLAVKNRHLVVDGAFLGRNELMAGPGCPGLFFVSLLVLERGGLRAGEETCPMKQGVQGFPVLLVGESEITEAGQLKPLRYLIRRYMTQLGFGGGREGVPYGSELGDVRRRSRGTGVQRP